MDELKDSEESEICSDEEEEEDDSSGLGADSSDDEGFVPRMKTVTGRNKRENKAPAASSSGSIYSSSTGKQASKDPHQNVLDTTSGVLGTTTTSGRESLELGDPQNSFAEERVEKRATVEKEVENDVIDQDHHQQHDKSTGGTSSKTKTTTSGVEVVGDSTADFHQSGGNRNSKQVEPATEEVIAASSSAVVPTPPPPRTSSGLGGGPTSSISMRRPSSIARRLSLEATPSRTMGAAMHGGAGAATAGPGGAAASSVQRQFGSFFVSGNKHRSLEDGFGATSSIGLQPTLTDLQNKNLLLTTPVDNVQPKRRGSIRIELEQQSAGAGSIAHNSHHQHPEHSSFQSLMGGGGGGSQNTSKQEQKAYLSKMMGKVGC